VHLDTLINMMSRDLCVCIYVSLWIVSHIWMDCGQLPSLSDNMQGTCLPLVTSEPASGPLSHNPRLIENYMYIANSYVLQGQIIYAVYPLVFFWRCWSPCSSVVHCRRHIECS